MQHLRFKYQRPWEDDFKPSFVVEKELKRSSKSSPAPEDWRLVDKQLSHLLQCSSIPENIVNALRIELDSQAQDADRPFAPAADGVKHPPFHEEGLNLGAPEFKDITGVLERSNYQPSPHQAATIKSHLADKNAHLAQIDRDILRLQLQVNEAVAAIKQLEKERIKTQTAANFYESWLAPVRLLPPEVLIRIFKYAINYHGPGHEFKATSPFILSQVNSSWRHAVLSCSTFWNRLKLPLSFRSSRNDYESGLPRSFPKIVDLWYTRANNYRPLKLHLTFDGTVDSGIGADIASGVTPFADRISYLSLTMEPMDYRTSKYTKDHLDSLKAFLTLPSDTFPSLKTLTYVDAGLYSSGSEADFESYPAITFLARSPHLEEVTLCLPPYMVTSTPRFVLPWGQLTKLYMGGATTVHSFVAIFFQCTQLKVAEYSLLDLRNTSIPEEPPIPTSLITFPNLTKFTMRLSVPSFTVSYDLEELFSVINVPRLESLKVAGGAPTFSDRFAALFPVDYLLMTAALPPLQHLDLVFADLDLDEVLSICSGCPELESLVLCLSTVNPLELIEAMTCSSHAQNGSERRMLPPTALSRLSFFTFGYIVVNDQEEQEHDFVAFGKAFVALVNSLLARRTANVPKQLAVELFVCYDVYSSRELNVEASFAEIEDYVREAMQGLDANKKEGQRNAVGEVIDDMVGGVTFDAALFDSYEKLLSTLGFEDRTRHLPHPLDF